ncbi:MAG: hypothetical protein Kow0062_15790 [Acidobacteriota bacterium]
MRLSRTPVSLLAAAALVAPTVVPPAIAADTLVEPSSGVAFELRRPAPADDAMTLELAGVGLRKKALIFKVYAFGLYLDPAAAREHLAPFRGRSADELRADPSFYEALAELPGERLCVMRFLRNVGADAMREALDASLDRTVSKDDPARAAFGALWTEKIRKGEEVAIEIAGDGTVTVWRDGRRVGSVQSAPIGLALMLSWVGPEPVSEDIKQGVAERIPDILAGS